jgi:hypothetical protein
MLIEHRCLLAEHFSVASVKSKKMLPTYFFRHHWLYKPIRSVLHIIQTQN